MAGQGATGVGAGAAGAGGLVCSARGCRRAAAWALLWNNPRLHTPERRKVWLACEEHRVQLGEFLSVRGFLADTVPADAIPDTAG